MKICMICGREFEHHKHNHRQKVCSYKKCQHQRQLSNMKSWRDKHPDYYKEKYER